MRQGEREDTTMVRMIELTDTFTDETATVPVEDVTAQLGRWGWLSVFGHEVDEFAAALTASDHKTAAELAAYLGVGFDEV